MTALGAGASTIRGVKSAIKFLRGRGSRPPEDGQLHENGIAKIVLKTEMLSTPSKENAVLPIRTRIGATT